MHDATSRNARRLLDSFIRYWLGTTRPIDAELDLRFSFRISDSEWIDLLMTINQLPWIQGRALRESEMLSLRTTNDIAAALLNRSDDRIILAEEKSGIDGELERFSNDEGGEYLVWFGTNRARRDAGDISKGFSSVRSEITQYGACTVFVPKSHQIGSIGSSWFKRTLSLKDDRLRLVSIDEAARGQLWAQIAMRLSNLSMGERHGVVFLHGYNVSFAEAAVRAAQIGFDLSIRGAMAFFSWPSQASLSGYPADEASIEASESAITAFLVNFVEKSGCEKVHLIAHSMGNRGLLRAVQRIAASTSRSTRKPFDQIVLAAPDVDTDVFRELCKAYDHVSNRTTVYVSETDRAVGLSNWLHGYSRVGFAPPVFVTSGIDTVNVTNVDLSMLGHGYVGDSRNVLQDIHELISAGRAPSERFGLREISSGESRYWEIGA